MKKLIYTLFLLVGCHTVSAQEISGTKDFGGFILDMGTMLNAESLVLTPIALPALDYMPELFADNLHQWNTDAFRINPHITYMGGTSLVSPSLTTMSLPYTGSGMVNWRGTSYKLNNGMRINLYGEYDADGRKVYNPSALPWERKNFNAAFEMKSSNGNFGIKIEVHGGRNNPY